MDKKKLMIAVFVICFIAVSAFVATKTFASKTNNGQGYIQSLANKLGINENKVSTAMTEVQNEERQTQLDSKLTQAVADGVITEDQKQKVIDKQNEISEKQKALNEEMQSWAEENNIDFDKLQQYLGFGRGNGKAKRMSMPGNISQNSPTQNQ